MSFQDGKILGSMCSAPHPLVWEVYLKYLEKNIGDPGLVPGLVDLEKDAIREIGNFLSHHDAQGRIITGGTEANILALWTARRNHHSYEKNEVILPETAHFSFDKAASLMGLSLKKIPVEKDFRCDPELMGKAVTKKTLAIVGIAGSTGLGAVDDIPAIGKLALEKEIYFHVDASFGGFVLPFLQEAGYPTLPFDFSVPGVSSLAIDPHKMGRGPIPSGCIIYRDKKLSEKVTIPVNYLSGGKTHIGTVVGTRSGATAAAVWAVVRHLGREGYVEIVKEAMDKTYWFTSQINALDGYNCVFKNPPLNVVGIQSHKHHPNELAQILRKKGWALSQWDTYLRVVLMPHVTKDHLLTFITDLKEVQKL